MVVHATYQEAESKLAKFVEDIIVPPRMIEIIVDGEVCQVFFSAAPAGRPFLWYIFHFQNRTLLNLPMHAMS